MTDQLATLTKEGEVSIITLNDAAEDDRSPLQQRHRRECSCIFNTGTFITSTDIIIISIHYSS